MSDDVRRTRAALYYIFENSIASPRNVAERRLWPRSAR